jgi:hypothetical protein
MPAYEGRVAIVLWFSPLNQGNFNRVVGSFNLIEMASDASSDTIVVNLVCISPGYTLPCVSSLLQAT